MSIYVDAYIVEDEEGGFMELFGDETQAEQYVGLFAFEGEAYGRKMTVRHTLVDIEG